MKNLLFVTLLLSLTCYSQKPSAEKDFSTRYKIALDSVKGITNSIYTSGSQTTMTIKNIKPGKSLLKELNSTAIKDITLKASSITKYIYNDKLIKQAQFNLYSITFKSDAEAESAFKRIKKIALEKSGVPGLTYTNDMVYRAKNTLYWFNSNCIYSKEIHYQLSFAASQTINILFDTSINCDCGDVICKEISWEF